MSFIFDFRRLRRFLRRYDDFRSLPRGGYFMIAGASFFLFRLQMLCLFRHAAYFLPIFGIDDAIAAMMLRRHVYFDYFATLSFT